MPVANLFRNCAYYWSFAAFVSYFVNHPLYTPPPAIQTYVCLALALGCQIGNWRCGGAEGMGIDAQEGKRQYM
jgi:very-long-chain enoyl-CoA reductase